MVATYSSVKNEWEVETVLPPATNITGTPPINVVPSADGQVIAWDDTRKEWVTKTLTYKTQDLTDVGPQIPTDNQILKWNEAAKQYQPVNPPGGDVHLADSDDAGNQPGTNDTQKIEKLYEALNGGIPAKEGDVIIISKGVNGAYFHFVGTWFFEGSGWVLGASGSDGGTPKPTINWRGSTADPQAPGVLAGDLDVVTENLNKGISVFDGANYQAVLRESEIKQWIAAGSLFQGAIDSKPNLKVDLPTPDLTNKGFYWTWTGPASTDVIPVDFPANGFTATLQVGDWIQSDGTKFIHVPSDLLSKLRWEGIGSFKTWADGSWEKDSLVIRNGRYYRAQSTIAPGDATPEAAGSKWSDITPILKLNDLSDVDLTGVDATKPYLKYDAVGRNFKPTAINLDDLGNVSAATKADGSVLGAGDVLYYDTTWKVNTPAALAKQYVTINDLKGFNITGIQDGDYLVYRGATSTWVNTPTVRATVDFLSDIGDVEIAGAPEIGQGLAWSGNKWVPQRFGGMEEYKPAATYAQNALVMHANSIWLATAEITPNKEPGVDPLWKKELHIKMTVLEDVDNTTPATEGQTLIYRAADQKWHHETVDTASTVNELTDTTITTPANGQVLTYQNNKWVNQALPTAATQTTVGDIKTSILTEVQFKAEMGADGGGWVLADGRNVSGSRYTAITGLNNVPDLRGAYLRMAGNNSTNTSWTGGSLNTWQEDTTRIPRNTQFTGSTDYGGGHTHNLWSRRMNAYSGAGYYSAARTLGEGISAGGVTDVSGRWMDSDGAHSHTTTVTGGGDTETRPKSYTVNYYIKIN
jgi:hypothetical protein